MFFLFLTISHLTGLPNLLQSGSGALGETSILIFISGFALEKKEVKYIFTPPRLYSNTFSLWAKIEIICYS